MFDEKINLQKRYPGKCPPKKKDIAERYCASLDSAFRTADIKIRRSRSPPAPDCVFYRSESFQASRSRTVLPTFIIVRLALLFPTLPVYCLVGVRNTFTLGGSAADTCGVVLASASATASLRTLSGVRIMKADVIIRRKIYEFILFSQHMRQGDL